MISALFSFVFRLLLTVLTVVFVLGLMAVALVTIAGLVLWSLIRGRKPTIDMSRFRAARGQFNAGRRPGMRSKPMGDVVDVEAREVPSTSPRLE